MALDIALLDDSDTPTATVPLGVDAHWELIQLARTESLELLLRLSDYYEEASFFQQELPSLARELEAVSRAKTSPELAEFARSARLLCDTARSAGRGLDAIPD